MGATPATDGSPKPRPTISKTWFNVLDKAALADALIPVTVALHLSESTRELGLVSLFSWIVLKLISCIQRQIRQSAPRETWLSWCVLLALVLLQARNIILRDDYRGPVLFLLIGSGLLIGSQLTQRSWQLLLSWMSLAIAPIALFFAIQLSASGDWSVQSMFDLYYATIQRSLGSINRLATLTTFLTLAAWYSATQARGLWWRGVHLALCALGYWVILGTDSRMAILAVPLAIALPWLGLRLRHHMRRRQWVLSLIAVGSLLGAAAWKLVIAPDIGSDAMRLQMASCWVRKGMLKSTERFWMGSGYDTSGLREACESVRPGLSFGHAHNTWAQVAGNHGLLGLIVLMALSGLILQGLWTQQMAVSAARNWSPWNSTNWSEISLGLNLALLFCALSTTVQEFSPINQLLIGLVAGTACINPVSTDDGKGMRQDIKENQHC